MGTERELSRRLKVRPRGVFLWAVPVGEGPFGQKRRFLTAWRIVQDGDERAARAGEVNSLQQTDVAIRVDDSLKCPNHESLRSKWYRRPPISVVRRTLPRSCAVEFGGLR